MSHWATVTLALDQDAEEAFSGFLKAKRRLCGLPPTSAQAPRITVKIMIATASIRCPFAPTDESGKLATFTV